MTGLERIIHLSPAFDKRHTDPKKDYGIHGVDLQMLLKGKEGAVQFLLYTNWQLPHVTEETVKRTLVEAQRNVSLSVQLGQRLPGDLKAVAEMLESARRGVGVGPVKAVDPITLRTRFLPMPAGLGYHSRTPRYKGQRVCQKGCEWLDGADCYYDGSGLNAKRIYEVLLREGSDGVWRELEKYYKSTFEVKKERRRK